MNDFLQTYNSLDVEIAKMQVKKQLMWEKAARSDDPEVIVKAMTAWQDVSKRDESKAKSFLFDPYNVTTMSGYKDHYISLSYDVLRRMAQAPIIASIVGTRIEQVAAFSQPQQDKYSPGFVIRKKRRLYDRNIDQKITKSDQRIAEAITEFILNGGQLNTAWHGDSFSDFLRKITKDTFELDQATFEVVRNRKGQPIEFFATDGATYRLADSVDDDKKKDKRLEINGYYPTHVQVLDGAVVAEFYPWELCFGIRNPTTNVRMNGYGRSELEVLINVVTWMLYSDAYNGKFFSQGSAPKGILSVKGNVNPSVLAEFRQQWQAMVSGVFNAWKVPVLQSDQMEWIDLQKNNRDMEFSRWQEYLIKLTCAIYKIDPAEIGFPMSGSTNSQAMMEGSNEAKLEYSRDKGLKPTLRFLESKINKFLINPLNPEFEFAFVGIDSESEEKEVDRTLKEMRYKSLKEIRRSRGLSDKVDEDDGIMDSAWLQWQQISKMGGQESNQAMDQMFGGGDEGEGAAPVPAEEEEEAPSKPIKDEFSGFDEVYSEKGNKYNPFMAEVNAFVKSLGK